MSRPEIFDDAIARGDYPPDFEQPEPARRFVLEVLVPRAGAMGPALRILECGCGNGGWLALLAETLPGAQGHRFHGFDISAGMVALARQRLRPIVPSARVHVGDVLEAGSYVFDETDDRYDLIFAYDVVQQVPRSRQAAACEAMISRLSSRGTLVIFDQDRLSLHGVRMGFMKFVTRFTGLPLVPRYFCAARYPSLGSLKRKMVALGRNVEIRRSTSSRKLALVVR